jgi:hypothetical protein
MALEMRTPSTTVVTRIGFLVGGAVKTLCASTYIKPGNISPPTPPTTAPLPSVTDIVIFDTVVTSMLPLTRHIPQFVAVAPGNEMNGNEPVTAARTGCDG